MAPFGKAQLHSYLHAYVAFHARERFEERFGQLEPSKLYREERETSGIQIEADVTTCETMLLQKLAEQLRVHSTTDRSTVESRRDFLVQQLNAVLVASTPQEKKMTTEWLAAVQLHVDAMQLVLPNNATKMGSLDFAMALIHSVHTRLAGGASSDEPVSQDVATSLVELSEGMRSDDMWSVRKFEQAMGELPELGALLTTPFMIKIVVKILPTLAQLASSPASIKADLILLMGEDDAANAFAKLRGSYVGSASQLKETQELLELSVDVATTGADKLATSGKSNTRNIHAELRVVAGEVTEAREAEAPHQVSDDELVWIGAPSAPPDGGAPLSATRGAQPGGQRGTRVGP